MIDFIVLTISWPAGPEEDWTASGWCEPGDLTERNRFTAVEENDRNIFINHELSVCVCAYL